MSLIIIAEVGINHNGDLEIAKKLIDMAKSCGCDAVKFQKRAIDVVYTQEMLGSYRESPWGTTQRAQKEGLEFDRKEYLEIDSYCRKIGIKWFASAWDIESQIFLRQFDCKYNKVASAMLTHKPLIKMIAGERKHTFISTGMSTYEEIDEAVSIFREHNCEFTLLHCVSVYPAKDEDSNLNTMLSIKEKYKCPVGYSGHEVGVLPSVLAVAMGAEAIERHITLDRAMYGSDQAASLEKRGLEILVRDARAVKTIMGDGVKRILPGEEECKKKLRYFNAV